MSWDDPTAYEYTASHTLQDWGWEFIRRDERYIKEWRKALAKFKDTPPHQVLMPLLQSGEINLYSDIASSVELNLINPDKTDTFVIPVTVFNRDQVHNWGMRFYQNPKEPNFNRLCISPVKKVHFALDALKSYSQNLKPVSKDFPEPEIFDDPHYFYDDNDTVTFNRKDNTLVFVLDLTKPINPQLDDIKAFAKKEQLALKKAAKKRLGDDAPPLRERAEKVSELNQEIWKRQLRCIDAQLAGIQRKEAAPIIFRDVPAGQGLDRKWDDALQQIKGYKESLYSTFMTP